jgi:chromosome segregation ATPase
MADNTGNEAKKNLKEINEIVSAIDSGFRSISSRLEDVADIISNTNNDARVFKNIINDVGRSINRLSKQNESLIDNQIKLNQGLLTSKKVREQINNIEATQAVLQSRLNTLRNQQLDGLILTEENLAEIVKLETELGQQSQDVTLRYQDQLEELEKIETK